MAKIRYEVQKSMVIESKPWSVGDDVLGHAAQLNGTLGPLAYFATESEARAWADEMNARQAAGTAPPFEVEIPYWIEDVAAFKARHAPSGIGSVKFV